MRIREEMFVEVLQSIKKDVSFLGTDGLEDQCFVVVEEEKLSRAAALTTSTILSNGFLVVARREALPKVSLSIHFSEAIEDIGRVRGKFDQNRW